MSRLWGIVVNDMQGAQASYPVKESGVGLCRADDIANTAYMASRAGGVDDYVALDARHVWDDSAPRSQGEGDDWWVVGASSAAHSW